MGTWENCSVAYPTKDAEYNLGQDFKTLNTVVLCEMGMVALPCLTGVLQGEMYQRAEKLWELYKYSIYYISI